MDARFIRGVSVTGYSVSLMVGIGVPIPILDEDMLYYTTVEDKGYPGSIMRLWTGWLSTGEPCTLGYLNYAGTQKRRVEFEGKKIPVPHRYPATLKPEIAGTLKQWISDGKFELGQPNRP